MKKLIFILAFLIGLTAFGQDIPRPAPQVNGIKLIGEFTQAEINAFVVPVGEFWWVQNSTVGEVQRWNGTAWVNFGSVVSVNAQTGTVVLNTDNIAEGATNQYYTQARVSANASVSANTAKISYPGDQNALGVPFSPYLTLGSLNVQAVVQELKDELDGIVTGGGHVIQNNGIPLAQRDSLNITGGATASDDLANNTTIIDVHNEPVPITAAAYALLSPAEKTNGTIYFCSDCPNPTGGSGVIVEDVLNSSSTVNALSANQGGQLALNTSIVQSVYANASIVHFDNIANDYSDLAATMGTGSFSLIRRLDGNYRLVAKDDNASFFDLANYELQILQTYILGTGGAFNVVLSDIALETTIATNYRIYTYTTSNVTFDNNIINGVYGASNSLRVRRALLNTSGPLTPTLAATNNYTVTVQNATYKKVGGIVYFNIRLNGITDNTPSGTVVLTPNFPFTVAQQGSASVNFSNKVITTGRILLSNNALVLTNGTLVFIDSSTTDGALLSGATFPDNDGYLTATGFYFTND